jgi:hypothetical protein
LVFLFFFLFPQRPEKATQLNATLLLQNPFSDLNLVVETFIFGKVIN